MADGADSKVYDLYSSGYFKPEEKETPALESEIEEIDGEVIFKVIRALEPDSD